MNAFWRPETGHALACQTWTLKLCAECGEDRRADGRGTFGGRSRKGPAGRPPCTALSSGGRNV